MHLCQIILNLNVYIFIALWLKDISNIYKNINREMWWKGGRVCFMRCHIILLLLQHMNAQHVLHFSLCVTLIPVMKSELLCPWFFPETNPSLPLSVRRRNGVCSQEETNGSEGTQNSGNQLHCKKETAHLFCLCWFFVSPSSPLTLAHLHEWYVSQ